MKNKRKSQCISSKNFKAAFGFYQSQKHFHKMFGAPIIDFTFLKIKKGILELRLHSICLSHLCVIG